MVTFSNICIRQGQRGLYFYDGNNNLFSVDLSFCDIPDNFVVDQSTVSVEGKLTRPTRDNLMAHLTVKILIVH